MSRWIFYVLGLLLPLIHWGQCAMCRTQIKNNVSHGETEVATGLNFGIMYLFFTPYLAVGVVAFLWFRYSKTDAEKVGFIRRFKR